jgi:chromosome segregation ATPase
MIESIMFAALGFLLASLLALILLPLVHARAVRLTKRRVIAGIPLSLSEIQADKDQLRAEYAMATRRLELSVEQLKIKSAAQLAEVGKKTEAISRLKTEMAALQEQLQSAKAGTAGGATEAAKPDEPAMLADSQRVEIVALKTQISTLQDRVHELERELRRGERAAAQLRTELEAARQAAKPQNAKPDETGQQELATLREQVAALKRDAANAEAERAENALLRERISSVSADVARLTAAVEGPNSPIPAMLAAEAQQKAAQNGGGTTAAPERLTLADRIRTLQKHAAPAAPVA